MKPSRRKSFTNWYKFQGWWSTNTCKATDIYKKSKDINVCYRATFQNKVLVFQLTGPSCKAVYYSTSVVCMYMYVCLFCESWGTDMPTTTDWRSKWNCDTLVSFVHLYIEPKVQTCIYHEYPWCCSSDYVKFMSFFPFRSKGSLPSQRLFSYVDNDRFTNLDEVCCLMHL